MPPIAFYFDPIFLEHETGPGHPERAERLRAILSLLRSRGLSDRVAMTQPRAATDDEIALVHPLSHIDWIRTVSADTNGASIDADTRVSARSFDAAARAVGAGLDACDAVMARSFSTAFCAVRPPGHHAETARAMGFCLFNNIAIAARYLRSHHGLDRIAIIDWDVHHGNGTQEVFEQDPNVLYVSLHQHPLYPGTGMASEIGTGAGEGFTLNIPMPSGTDDDGYRDAFARIVPRLASFRPEFILVSAGFDAHRRDPLASMLVTNEGFRWMMNWALERASELCDGRLVAMLEGGYDAIGLSESVCECIEAMLDDAAM